MLLEGAPKEARKEGGREGGGEGGGAGGTKTGRQAGRRTFSMKCVQALSVRGPSLVSVTVVRA
jgi:hypothetical protein